MKTPKTTTNKTRFTKGRKIATAATFTEQRCLARYGQPTPQSEVQFIAEEWRDIRSRQINPKRFETQAPLTTNEIKGLKLNQSKIPMAEKKGAEFFKDKMLRWDAEAFIQLGKEMLRLSKLSASAILKRRRNELLLFGATLDDAATIILNEMGMGRKAGWAEAHEKEVRTLRRIKENLDGSDR
jgi:hypothetical protein